MSTDDVHVRLPGVCAAFELRFASLFHEGRALAFPCDERGRVDLDRLSERARHNYLFARVATGREYAAPTVIRRVGDE
jgi:hypothetical protein